MKRTLSTAALVLAIVAAPLAPASAWNPFTEPPRTMWCKVWPSFCR